MMHAFSANYLDRDERRRFTLLDRGFWVHVPRPLLTCRLFGHQPVIDGTTGVGNMRPHRWVCCDRCGVRPNPQGSLDPAAWNIGEPIPAEQLPGAWPRTPEGVLGGQVIIGRSFPSWGASVKVGNCGSEHTLAAHIQLHPLFAVYLHTERFGTWLQRRLNPTGYQSKVIGLSVHGGRLYWQLWVDRDGQSPKPPRWREGSVRVNRRAS